MRGLYAHASQRMRDELTDALQARCSTAYSPPIGRQDSLLPGTPVKLISQNSSQDDEDPIPQGG